MSNHLAVATVTAGLRQLIANALTGSPLDGTSVDIQRPDDGGQNGLPQISLFLFQVSPNTAWRNEDLPTRDAGGAVVQRPQVALNLDYLLTFFGADAELVPHRLLGLTVRQLHSEPILVDSLIEDAISAHPVELAGSDLADQVVSVKLSALPLNLEELSKLWSVFFQIPYVLSVAYRASVVLIEADETPRRALPVRRRDLFVTPLRRPRIECAIADDDANPQIFADSLLVLEGSQLAGPSVQVHIDGEAVEPTSVSDSRVTVDLAPLGLAGGVHRVQVVQPVTDAPEHLRFASNAVPFLLHPRILGVPGFSPGDPDEVTLTLDVPITEGQQLVLMLDELLLPEDDATPRGFLFEQRATAAIAQGDPVVLAAGDLPTATYLVRLQIDGADSPLEFDEGTERYDQPQVIVP